MRSCLVDGEIATHVPADDRALAYGDGVFETIAVSGGRPRLWQDHMDRLGRGCERLAIVDPVAAQEYREKQEKARIEERLLMRHQSKNKFAKSLKRFGGGMQNENSREAFHAMIRERDQLKRKIKGV